MSWYKKAITQKEFYEFYGYSGLSKEDLQKNPTLFYNMIEHLNYIREYYLQYFLKEIPGELEYARYETIHTNEETLNIIDDLINNFSYDDFEKAALYFANLYWRDELIGGAAWVEISQWADKLWKIGEIPQALYTPNLMQQVLNTVFIIDTIHSLQHNTNMALIDLPENEARWLGVALEVVKHIQTPYQASQLSNNKELMRYLRNQDELRQLPTKSHADIYVNAFEKLIQSCLKENDDYEAVKKLQRINEQILSYMDLNAGAYLAQALQKIIDLDPYPSINKRLSSLLKIMVPYIVGRKWFRHNLNIFEDYLNIYQDLYLGEELVGGMLAAIKNQNELKRTFKFEKLDYFTISKGVYNYLLNLEYSWMLEDFTEVEE